MIRREVR
jgi:hypothetical protein